MRGFDLVADLLDDGSRQKEVFARFGRTVFKTQVFDHALVNLLTVAGMIDERMSPDEIDKCFDGLFRKTSGQLVNDVDTQSRLETQILEICRSAVAERNRLIHRFFREHAENFMSCRGQQVMLDDLGEVGDLIEKADSACQRVMMRIGAPYGFNDEVVQVHVEQMMERLSTSDIDT